MEAGQQVTLKSCPACNQQLSSMAATCPHCGHPMVDKRAPGRGAFAAKAVMLLGFLSVVASFILGLAPHANYFHLVIADGLLFGGLLVILIGAVGLLLTRTR